LDLCFSEKSFETSYLKCVSKSNISGLSMGERWSKMSEAEILKLAHQPNFSNLDNLSLQHLSSTLYQQLAKIFHTQMKQQVKPE
jgi:hypothetical protein